MTEPVDVAAIRAALAKATPGPWEQGDVWLWAGVMPKMFGEGRCCMCKVHGEPVWVGRSDINGKRMLAHKHRQSNPYQPDHLVSGPDGLVTGNYDYEAGGILDSTDANLIVLLRNNADALLDSWAESLAALDRVYAESERRGAETALRSAAEAWANVQVPDGTWSASEIADWLSIKADLIEEGGDL